MALESRKRPDRPRTGLKTLAVEHLYFVLALEGRAVQHSVENGVTYTVRELSDAAVGNGIHACS